MRFADRAHKYLFNNGLLTPNAAIERFRARAQQIDMAIIAESARWGSASLTKDTWLSAINNEINNFFPSRTQVLIDQLKSTRLRSGALAPLYPSVTAPMFSQHGGVVPSGFTLQIQAPTGTIYYTLDCSDPRMLGGAVNAAHATTYSGAIKLTKSTHVKARVLSGSTWSALNEATFAVGPVAENLRITEIMYHPPDTGSPNDPNKEFIELKNIGSETINLNLARFTNGIEFTFPSVELAAGKYILVVKDQAAFYARYPDFAGVIAGQYSGSLANDGERIRLEDAVGQTILDFEYSDAWRGITDGQGFSLTIINPANPDTNSWGEKDAWRASAFYGGSPGWDDSGIIPEP